MKHPLRSRLLALFLVVALLAAIVIPCVLAITGTLVKNDAERHALCTALSGQAKDYYTGSYSIENLNALSGVYAPEDSWLAMQDNALYNALQKLMTETHTKTVTYSGYTSNALATYWEKTDAAKDTSRYVLFYSDIEMNDGYTMNREHIWPKSKASFHEKGGGSDLQHLRPSHSGVNSSKKDRAFGNVNGKGTPYQVDGVDVIWNGDGILEVRDNVKGDVARILLYVYCRWAQPNLYSDVPADKLPPFDVGDTQNSGDHVITGLDTLLEWVKLDPVDEWEMMRNDQAENVQGNRNVFIDHPEFAWKLFGMDVPDDLRTPATGGGCYVHHPEEGTVTLEPTCTEEGMRHTTCTVCGMTLDLSIPALGHDLITQEGKEATCLEAGITTGEYCTRCDYEVAQIVIPALGHDIVTDEAIPATCTEDGSTAGEHCTRCDYSTVEVLPALGHDWDEGTVTKEPTETENGERTFACSRCGETYTEVIPALGHEHAYTATVIEPTCLEPGYTLYTCVCGDSYESDPTEALGHDIVTDAAVEPTCTQSGLTRGEHCARCDYRVEQQTVAALGHNIVSDAAVEPTCTEPGLTEGFHCDRCGEVLTAQEEVPALGHDYTEGLCIRCGELDPNFDPKDPCEGYTDINRDLWYHNAIDFALSRSLMGSTKTDALTFEPMTACTRAMIATMLYSLEGKPEVTYEAKFPDVGEKQWFTDAVMWAYQHGVVTGYDNGNFGPNDKVTREQMAVILKAYTEKVKALDTGKTAELSGFADAEKATWSKSFVSWAVAEGLISGKAVGEQLFLDPQGNASRAEVAAILMSYITNIAEAK